jgi:hypothetical protein
LGKIAPDESVTRPVNCCARATPTTNARQNRQLMMDLKNLIPKNSLRT